MAHPFEHARSSAKKFGGRPEDYLAIHASVTWTMNADEPPLLGMTAVTKDSGCDTGALNLYDVNCDTQYLLVRDPSLIDQTGQEDLKKLMQVTSDGLFVFKSLQQTLIAHEDWAIAVNGTRINVDQAFPFKIPNDSDAWTIQWFRTYPQKGCRFYSPKEKDREEVNLWPSNFAGLSQPKAKNNGITVGKAKLFDSAALRTMLNATAAQLGALSGFNAASITAAFGNLQGVSRDTSFLSAQITTTPLPVVSATNTAGLTGNGSTTVSSSGPTTTSGTVILQCPDGSLPSLGSGFNCGALPTGSQPVTGPATGTQTSTSTTNNPTTTQQTNGTAVSQQNSTTTTSGGFAGTVPTAPASTAFSAPTNVGVGSADILAEQVQLNAQITTLRLLLQGALSDQYLLRNSRVVANRQQTTLGFTVSLDPPRQFRHAVAEVSVVLISQRSRDAVSIMNLLPAEKTYNVAKITSNQKSFGAGVAVSPVSVGASTGKAKDRLYIVQDTDTLAYQFPVDNDDKTRIGRPWPQNLHDKFKSLVGFATPEELNDCPANPADEKGNANRNAIAFGWQFRPVLGADYVKGGQRQVFAQLALPAGVNQNSFKPDIYVLTRWRAYDPNRQVVGAVYSSSCSQIQDASGVTYVNRPSVYDVSVTDLGAGQLELRASGQFHSSGLSVLAGAANLTPLLLDGDSIDLFGNAHDLLEAGQLTLVGQNGQNLPFGIETTPKKSNQCGIKNATLKAIPYPDGNSRADLKVTLGEQYSLDTDGHVTPYVLLSGKVYGLKETPFTSKTDKPCTDGKPVTCDYHFIAPTTDLRNAQRFLVRDVTWDQMERTGEVDFYPMFTGLTVSSTYGDETPKPAAKAKTPPAPASDSKKKPATDATAQTKKPAAPAKQKVDKKPDVTDPTTFYEIAGYDFDKLHPCFEEEAKKRKFDWISQSGDSPSPKNPCLIIYVGNEDRTKDVEFTAVTKNLATMTLSKSGLGNAKGIRFLLADKLCPDADPGKGKPSDCFDDSRVEWDLPLPKPPANDVTASVSFLRVSDSRLVSFKGGDISKIDAEQVTFEGKKLTATLKSDTLDVLVTTDVTKTPGHKELTAATTVKDDKGKVKMVQLPIDVLK